QWNRNKKVYDLVAVLAVVAYLVIFVVSGSIASNVGVEILVIRALGTCAIGMLTVILCIGPLARLDARWNVLLYNRRHLGVMTFLIGFAHATLATLYYGGFGVQFPVTAMLVQPGVTFEVFGFFALLILFVMAATSHDFWLKNLTPGVWKALHMLVYVAYALLVAHVFLGSLQEDCGMIPTTLMVTVVAALHLAAGVREWNRVPEMEGEWLDVGPVEEIPLDRARLVCPKGGERIAVFRHAGGVSAISNVCAHQGGPLGEGKIVDGCVTCPWHGYQYLPESGTSPPPYTEKIATYEVRVRGARVEVRATPNAPGTPVTPATSDGGTGGGHA
ncbi:MAG: ferric reductase-like transmembrane domain-containing protein, partial [Phycisphaerales bacterium]|nr:ferric reductase-like transmembrane domain-containing protein [Phycisphaerales bacterium]